MVKTTAARDKTQKKKNNRATLVVCWALFSSSFYDALGYGYCDYKSGLKGATKKNATLHS